MPGLDHGGSGPDGQAGEEVGNLIYKNELRIRELRNRVQTVLHHLQASRHSLADTDRRHPVKCFPGPLIALFQGCPDQAEIIRQGFLPHLQKNHFSFDKRTFGRLAVTVWIQPFQRHVFV